MATKQSASFQELSQELDEVMSNLQAEDIDIEDAVKAYERGMTIVQELEKQLKITENKVKKIKLQFEK